MRKIHLFLILTLSVVATLTVAHRMVPSFRSTAQTGSLAAPTEVTASDNAYSTKVGISWNAISGANLYRIFRDTTNNSATATAIGTTADGTFFDTTATSGQTFFYWVRAENGSTVSSVSAPDTGVRANGVINGPPPLNPPPQPAGNTVTAAKAFLGKTLFWDEQLSSTQTVACGTCHFASNGGSDARARSEISRCAAGDWDHSRLAQERSESEFPASA